MALSNVAAAVAQQHFSAALNAAYWNVGSGLNGYNLHLGSLAGNVDPNDVSAQYGELYSTTDCSCPVTVTYTDPAPANPQNFIKFDIYTNSEPREVEIIATDGTNTVTAAAGSDDIMPNCYAAAPVSQGETDADTWETAFMDVSTLGAITSVQFIVTDDGTMGQFTGGVYFDNLHGDLILTCFTPTPQFTATYTNTPTDTPGFTATFTNTATQTITDTPLADTATPTNTVTATVSNTATNTATNTGTSTATNTATNTATATATNSATNTATDTITSTPTDTPTVTSTATPTVTATFTNTFQFSPTNTMTNTITLTATNTATFTVTLTPTFTATNTITNTPTVTATYTLTNTSTLTFTNTPSSTPTNTLTPQTSTFTNTPTFTPTITATVPLHLVIFPPFPNPSTGPPMTFQVEVPTTSTVTMDVFTLAFRKIESQTMVMTGIQAFQWDLRDRMGVPCANGLYYVRIRVSGLVAAQQILKIMILK